MQEVYNELKKLNLNNKENIVVASSGGPDSMCLLSLFVELKKEYNFEIVCAHVHHNLRKESDQEAINLQNYCNRNNIIFEIKKIDKYPNNKFSEESARKIRYKYFDEIIKKYNSKYLFTAHHGDDLIETMLMRITRGSSLKGYAGIEKTSIKNGYTIIRPLLTKTKKEIEEYDQNNEIPYSIDSSNYSDKYTRNRYRKYILPKLKEEKDDIHLSFLKMSEEFLEINDYLLTETTKVLNEIYKHKKLDLTKFNLLHKTLQKQILNKILLDIYKENISKINKKHISLILDICNQNKNISISLPLNYNANIEYDYLTIEKNEINKDYEYILEDKIILSNNKTIERSNFKQHNMLKSNNIIYLNSKNIKMPIIIRNRKKGDRIFVKNMLKSKSVKDIFINEKVPPTERLTWPIVTDSNNTILWIPGIKKSNNDCNSPQDCDIILKYY